MSDIPKGKLDNVGVTWVVPDFMHSDHAGPQSTDQGPSWVADVVNAIGTRTQLWNSSVVVVLWDDWGGWYDNAPPPQKDFRGLGLRTPMLILSPYAMQNQSVAGGNGTVSTVLFEPGSILKFIEQVFNLPTLASLGYYYGNNLGYTDQRANSIDKTLNFSQSPRPFGTPIPTKYGASYFLYQPGSGLIPDNE